MKNLEGKFNDKGNRSMFIFKTTKIRYIKSIPQLFAEFPGTYFDEYGSLVVATDSCPVYISSYELHTFGKPVGEQEVLDILCEEKEEAADREATNKPRKVKCLKSLAQILAENPDATFTQLGDLNLPSLRRMISSTQLHRLGKPMGDQLWLTDALIAEGEE